jgi:ribulose 1,5-bisphosphate synthetase/thiazole synthase
MRGELMEKYTEKERDIPVAASVDVLVLGGGPAGFSAAVCAGREGRRVMLVEQSGDVGGVATTGLMSHWTGNTRGGFYEEIRRRSGETPESPIINPEWLKTVCLDMLEEERVRLRLYTFAAGVVMEGDRIKGVIVESKSGREAILAKVVIDATGDGDIACKAGAPYIKGRESDGKMQPMSIMFKVAGVDYDRAVFPGFFEDTIQIPKGEIQALGREHLPFPAGHVLLYRSSLPGVVTCNMTNCIDVDGTNADDLTRATVVCRHQMHAIVRFLRDYVPGYEECYLISSSSIIGVRETRHFEGERTLTEQDILEARVFDDWAVTRASFNFDVHNITGSGLDATGAQKKFPQQKGYTIPYGCFVPLRVEGLLIAGRCISGTHMAHSNYRVMPICANMGQAVGLAAALCVERDCLPRHLPVGLLQEKLRAQGVEP